MCSLRISYSAKVYSGVKATTPLLPIRWYLHCAFCLVTLIHQIIQILSENSILNPFPFFHAASHPSSPLTYYFTK